MINNEQEKQKDAIRNVDTRRRKSLLRPGSAHSAIVVVEAENEMEADKKFEAMSLPKGLKWETPDGDNDGDDDNEGLWGGFIYPVASNAIDAQRLISEQLERFKEAQAVLKKALAQVGLLTGEEGGEE